MAEITDAKIQDVLEYCERATAGPWDYHGYSLSYHIAQVLSGHFQASPRVVHATLEKDVYDADSVDQGAGGVRKQSDAVFIANARTDLPAFATALLEAQTELRLETDAKNNMREELDDERERTHALRARVAELEEEQSVDSALAELREMFPGLRDSRAIQIVTRKTTTSDWSGAITKEEGVNIYYGFERVGEGPTSAEAMAAVREWKEAQQ